MNEKTLLIADDDKAIRMVLSKALEREGYQVRLTGNASTLWRWVSNGEGDLVISDVVMPDENGLDLLPKIKKIRPGLPVIIMSAQNTLMTALKATERGAYEYLPKPFDLNEVKSVVAKALTVKPGTVRPEEPVDDGEELPLIGRSPAMQNVYRVMARLMTTDLTVTISGESGTGKELVAKALHDFGKRKNSSFVALNMAAIPRELIESELFGHEKGAFTGAESRSSGRFEQAQGGTLFLDEIGDMPLEAQTRLLRVLQEGEYTTVGGRRTIKCDVRIICATHRDLKSLISQGLFREDLYYRLNVVPLRLPSLRERVDDIHDLMRHFLNNYAQENGQTPKLIEGEALGYLKQHDWPGNVRELENLCQRIAALYIEDTITLDIVRAEMIPQTVEGPESEGGISSSETLQESINRHLKRYFDAHLPYDLPPAGLYSRLLREFEKPLLENTLAATRGNQIKAADLLGLNRNTLRKKIRDLDIDVRKG
ncbi:nitrogen regulation protein NR(I) [Paremcibacter congregatus]|uniref:DNA-binding transcriptional regulator NtrC n=1 Tax=Paremcibacter congregatus TaxID=2043170 RepID=A0A2G4YXJ4_9PROT|nr:nitrogen regulation protein NR(I) [Paremcibacter congregatus]PHZ86156.1 nitrogen regulation protein NR(I) [Paremcibacter congregatus]QDE29205.1 nitrogen regulation protein NR(I) [Paremcibacter congregatus]